MIKKNKIKIAAIAMASTLAFQNLQTIFALDNILGKEEPPVVVEPSEEEKVEEPSKEPSNENNEETEDKDSVEDTEKPENSTEDIEKPEDSNEDIEKPSEEFKNNKITILHTNDIHGRFKRDDKSIGLDIVASIKNQTENSILVDAGDTIHGLPLVDLNKGQDAINLLNAAGYEYMVPGNHDFNYGYKRLIEVFNNARIKNGTTKLKPLASNIKKDGSSLFNPSAIKVMNVNGKEIKVGFFGITTEETRHKSYPRNVKGLDFKDPVITSKQEVKNLKSKGADVIIALGHIGIDESSKPTSKDIIKEVDGIDVFVDGHSHSAFQNGKKINNTMLVSTGQHLSNLGKVEIELDENNDIVNINASLLNKGQVSNIKPDEYIQSKIKKIEDEQSEILSTTIGKTETYLDGSIDNVRTKETNLGNLIADAMLNETNADISLINGGGIRSSINKGDITKGYILDVLPFSHTVVTKELTGAQIKEVLEFGVKDYGTPFSGFTHVGGMKYVVDPKEPVGKRIVSIKINGKNIDMDKTYTVATDDFIALGGDYYPVFDKLPILNEHSNLDIVLENYIKKLETVNYKESEGRITTGNKSDFIGSVNNNTEDKPESGTNNNKQNNNKEKAEVKKIDSINNDAFTTMSYTLLGGAALVGLGATNNIIKMK